MKLERVWQVIERDLVPLREAVQSELARHISRGNERDSGFDIGF